MTEQQGREVEPNQDLRDTWTDICESLRTEIGEASYQSWIKPMRLIGREGDAVRTGVPTRFMREWIQAHYQDRLSELLGGRGLKGGLDVVIHQEHGAVVLTDGPFAETKEQLGGFYMVSCTDLDQALHYAKPCPVTHYGRLEVRPIMAIGDA